MGRLVIKLVFLWVGNVLMWMYYGGTKSMVEVANEDNETLGLISSVIVFLLVYFSF